MAADSSMAHERLGGLPGGDAGCSAGVRARHCCHLPPEGWNFSGVSSGTENKYKIGANTIIAQGSWLLAPSSPILARKLTGHLRLHLYLHRLLHLHVCPHQVHGPSPSDWELAVLGVVVTLGDARHHHHKG